MLPIFTENLDVSGHWGLQGPYAERSKSEALPSRGPQLGRRPLPGQGRELGEMWKAPLIVKSCDSKDDLRRDRRRGSEGTGAADGSAVRS